MNERCADRSVDEPTAVSIAMRAAPSSKNRVEIAANFTERAHCLPIVNHIQKGSRQYRAKGVFSLAGEPKPRFVRAFSRNDAHLSR
jgi:hypothetical protein